MKRMKYHVSRRRAAARQRLFRHHNQRTFKNTHKRWSEEGHQRLVWEQNNPGQAT